MQNSACSRHAALYRDFTGDVLRSLMFLPCFILLAIGTGIGYLLAAKFPTLCWMIGSTPIFWVPPLIALHLIFCIGGVLKSCVESVKAIYFTIFYTTMRRGEEIPAEYREQLTGYLRMGS